MLAVSGLGAAIFPWMMGYISTHSGSLRMAMVVPGALALLLLLLSLLPMAPVVEAAPALDDQPAELQPAIR
ncbi:hypothetical protein GOB94_03400 [Granulicella sp. 5B5]|uniref:hypothetical protein n=1 Tax=Granulicella sp. 5B5 TaxID=1617967 RepID=UPI00174F7FC5|nr:hypothetical protein [Granulicella sp. 5B5]QMV17847.1 hypothetical protein GOB94_03400 [Granulicella sp. 5B5]